MGYLQRGLNWTSLKLVVQIVHYYYIDKSIVQKNQFKSWMSVMKISELKKGFFTKWMPVAYNRLANRFFIVLYSGVLIVWLFISSFMGSMPSLMQIAYKNNVNRQNSSHELSFKPFTDVHLRCCSLNFDLGMLLIFSNDFHYHFIYAQHSVRSLYILYGPNQP